MREIKFRAWLTDEYPIEKYRNSFVMWEDIDMNGCLSGIEHGNVILEQYTGVKDKKGLEIYEGDVIEYYRLYECHSDAVDYFSVEPQNNFPVNEVYFEKVKGEVIFKDGCFSVKTKRSITPLGSLFLRNFESKLEELDQCGCLDLPLNIWLDEAELTKEELKTIGKDIVVIGNIHDREN